MTTRAPAMLAALLALTSPAYAAAQQVDSAAFARVDAAMLDDLRRTGTPGGAVAIVSGDRIVYARGYGATGGAPVTPDMLFRVQSVTKVFTAATLVTLADAHHVDLGAPVGTRLGELAEPLRQVTLHQLLSHTAGLAMGPVPPAGGDPATALAEAAGKVPMRAAVFAPGEIFSYSNVGYLLAGRAIETLGGRPYAELVRETLLAPLGMTATTFDSAAAARTGVASGFTDPAAVPPAGAVPTGPQSWPFAGLYSSARELARLPIAFMNGGRYEGRQVLSPATIARIASPVKPYISGEGDYGYGVRVYRHRGVDVVEHGGSGLDGYRSLLYMVPSRRIAVVVLANRAGGRPYAVADAALDALLPGALEPVPPTPPVVPMDAAEMARYVGRYAAGAMVEVSVDDGVLTLHQGAAAMPIRKLADGRLIAGPPDGGQRIAFVPGADGSAAFVHYNMRAFRRL